MKKHIIYYFFPISIQNEYTQSLWDKKIMLTTKLIFKYQVKQQRVFFFKNEGKQIKNKAKIIGVSLTFLFSL